MGSKALVSFGTLIESVDDLIEIHGRLQEGGGRRHRQEALHRAGVVLIVAAWQAYIEKLSLETLDLIEQSIVNRRKPAPAWIRSAFYFRSPAVRQSIGALNTPNSENVVKLLEFSFGLNPKSYWTWTGRRTWSAQEFCNRTNEWLRIRHTIAHGNGLPDNLTWLKNDSGTARLNLNLLKEAKRHFEKLASLTDKAMCDHLNNQYAVKCRWYR